MPSARRMCSRWPPAPSVEDESESLARELHGLSHLGDKLGVEGARARGTVDQQPIIMTMGTSTPPSTPPSVPSVPGLGKLSSDDSFGPLTPTASSRTRGRPQVHQQPSRDLHSRPGSRPPSRSRDGSLSERAPAQVTSLSCRGMGGSDHTRRGPVHKTYIYPAKSSLGRSNSARYGPATERRHYRSESNPGYHSDSISTGNNPHPPRFPPAVHENVSGKPSRPPTLAERIDDKLKQRRERRYTISVSDIEARKRAGNMMPLNTVLHSQVPASAPLSPSHEPRRVPSSRSSREQSSAPPSRTISAPTSAPLSPSQEPHRVPSSRSSREQSSDPPSRTTSIPPTRARSRSDVAASVPLQRSTSKSGSAPKPLPPNEARPGPTHGPNQPAARQTVSNKSQASSLGRSGSQSSSASSSQHQSTPQPPISGLCLSPCPRSIPISGYQDWYTLKGLEHLDICPSCMSQIAHSRFRNFFNPSLSKPANQKTHCAFANPWTRLAWTQMIKKQHDSLEMLYQMTRPPPGTKPCPGRIVTEQTWHRIIDPDTGLYLPRFHICSSCARNARVLMPAHRDTFPPSSEPQARVCTFVTTSPRLEQYINLLDISATQAETTHSRPNIRDLLSYARRKVVLRDCRRDRPIFATWHYIPSLPELCVCEDCYDEVIWPLARSHRRIARLFTTDMRLLPGDGPGSRCREASCQLYSQRMRAKFRDAVDRDDFAALKSLAMQRVEAERRFRDRREELIHAEERGFDCQEEMRKAVVEWRRWE